MGLYVAGHGYLSSEEIAVREACRDHDARLVFKRDPRNGLYTIFQRLPRDSAYVKHQDAAELLEGDLFPVRAYQELPSIEAVHKWLYENDAARGDLLDKVQRHNRDLKAKMDKDHFENEIKPRAEYLEHVFRRNGEDTGRFVSTRNNGSKRQKN